MAAITQRFKPRIKAFVRYYFSDFVKEINRKRKVIDIIIHPKSIPFGDTTAAVINYCDEWECSSYSAIQVIRQ